MSLTQEEIEKINKTLEDRSQTNGYPKLELSGPGFLVKLRQKPLLVIAGSLVALASPAIAWINMVEKHTTEIAGIQTDLNLMKEDIKKLKENEVKQTERLDEILKEIRNGRSDVRKVR